MGREYVFALSLPKNIEKKMKLSLASNEDAPYARSEVFPSLVGRPSLRVSMTL
jgi:hypothetical protein